jgi:transcriptional regulator with XRE-family HTH domain
LIRETFGPRLRAERERRGISLDSIAARTKIKRSFLESLERGDFSKWPVGTVFRRAYVRDYAEAIGLSPESIVEDFIRLFPVDDQAAGARSRHAATIRHDNAEPLALTFERGPTWRARLTSRHAHAAAIDVCVLLVVGGTVALVSGASIWTATGALAFLYYPITAILWGRSAAARYLEARPMREMTAIVAAARELVVAAAPVPELLEMPAPMPTVVSRLDAVVDPVFLSASHAPHAHQPTTTH